MIHDVLDLIRIFNQCFEATHHTQLVKGGDEPLYLPKTNTYPYHRIIFARGYFSSGLHEIAHWLIAGKARRELEDYGYWYLPDGRNEVEQKAFEQVELKPQALEWILADACAYSFQVSVDNLNGPPMDISKFKDAIMHEKQQLLRRGLNERSNILCQALQSFYS
ncbi:MAG: elongation factor P hydroxylase [Gammaproteobacteria bacterium]|nr:elongation factor P hydroxylase [Gammaproteobacteria bacterium]